jgi:histidinol phosphatase-like PHP family hydrolase
LEGNLSQVFRLLIVFFRLFEPRVFDKLVDLLGTCNCRFDDIVIGAELQEIVSAKEDLIEDYEQLTDFVLSSGHRLGAKTSAPYTLNSHNKTHSNEDALNEEEQRS